MFLYVKITQMKILKELSGKEFRDKFGTKDQCLAYLAMAKWGEEYTCRKCKNDRFITGKRRLIDVVLDAVMTSHLPHTPCFTK